MVSALRTFIEGMCNASMTCHASYIFPEGTIILFQIEYGNKKDDYIRYSLRLILGVVRSKALDLR